MITVVSSTNRPQSKTHIVSKYVHDVLKYENEVQLLDLQLISHDIIHFHMYQRDGLVQSLHDTQDSFLINSNIWLFVIPEYNGSYPGILKLFIDAVSMRKFSDTFHNKKAGLIGISSGRAGNIRGMDHFTALLNYLKITTYHNKLPLSSIGDHIDDNNFISDATQIVLKKYIQDFVAWSL